MKSFFSALCLIACAFWAAPIHAQGVGSSGSISGTVTDPNGAVVPKATVIAEEAAKGLQHTSATDDTGQYLFPALPPGVYNVTVQISSFQTETQKGVFVSVGSSSVLDFHLKLSGSSTQVEVTSELPVVETERGSQSNVVSQQYIADLPINRRDYLTFTLLAPGVTDSTRLASDQDFRVKQTPQSGLSFYGSNGRGNSVTVDGGEANDDSGGVRLTLSQDAVQEFQINRSNYSADLGGASGASINIVSKSGTNQLHGSLYGFFRNDGMDARDPFAFSQALAPGTAFDPAAPDSTGTPVKDGLSRQQFGGTFGFPIKKDKTFFFGSFEGLRQNAQNAVPILTSTSIFRPEKDSANNQAAILTGLAGEGATPVPCLTGQPALPAATCAAILQNVLTINPATSPLSQFVVGQFEDNGGVFPYNTREYLASGRLDHVFDENNSLMIRYNFGHDLEQNPDVQSLTGFSRGSDIHAYDNTLQAAWYRTFNPRTQNEVRAQWNYSTFDVIPNEPSEVGLDIPGFANLGTNIFLPSLTIMRRYEVADNVTLVRGRHTFKAGAEFLYRGNHTESHTFFPGRFVFGSLPGGLLSPCLQVPAACGLTASPAEINSIQSVALGLPQFFEQGFGNPATPQGLVGTYNYPRPYAAFYVQDAWKVTPHLTLNYGLRYELDAQYGKLNTDKNNFAPRVSIAWDPFQDHKTVFRAGFGIFYSPIYGQIGDVVQTLGDVNGVRQIANILVPLTGSPGNPALNSAAIFQTLFAQGLVQCTAPAAGQNACITPGDLQQFGINITHTGAIPSGSLAVLFSGQPGYRNPYSEQAELGIERQIGTGLSVSVSGIYVHTLALPVAIDSNLLPNAPLTTVKLANGQDVSFRNWGSSQCVGVIPDPCVVDPTFSLLQNDVYSSKGSALYEGGIVEIKKRFSDNFSLMANYTYSKAFDTNTDFNSDFGPEDNTDLSAERALSDFDQRHKIVVAAVLNSPWKERILSGFQLSPIVRYNSGHPFNLLAQGNDINGDNHNTNDRPIGAGRNTGLGPNYATFDMRLSWTYKIGEKAGLEFLAEGFNLFNRTNFASVNNEVSPNFGLASTFTTFNVHGMRPGTILADGTAANVSTPLTFTSAFPMRQIQLGLRLSF